MLKSIYVSNFVYCFPQLLIINGTSLEIFKNLEFNHSSDNSTQEENADHDLIGRVLLKNLDFFKEKIDQVFK